MKKFLIVSTFIAFFMLPKLASAENLYVSQSGAGGQTGADCANAHTAAWFNTAANWGGGAGEIDANDFVKLCGTFTGTAGQVSMLTCPANVGTAGNPVTIESDISDPAIFTATYWGGTSANNGAVIRCSYGNVTIDGHNVGIVRATANGTALANQQDSGRGIVAGSDSTGSSNVIVRNWTVQDLYVHTGTGNDTVGSQTMGIVIYCLGGCTVSGNTVDDAYICNSFLPMGTGTGAYIFSNIFHDCHNGITAAPLANGTWTTFLIHDNNMYNTANWDTTGGGFHNELIHYFAAGGVTMVVNDSQNYNNYYHGNSGGGTGGGATGRTTGFVFVENPTTWSSTRHFNNLYVLETGGTTDGMLVTIDAPSILNNTFVNVPATGNAAINVAGTVASVQNNVVSGFATPISAIRDPFSLSGTWNRNYYYGATSIYGGDAGGFMNFAQWQAYCSCDANSTFNGASPDFTGDYHINTGSPMRSAGANLTTLASTLSIPALLLDKDGVARPGGATAWDIGAYQFGTSSPSPPHHLTVIIN